MGPMGLGASFSSSSSSYPATRSDGRARNASRSDAGGSIGVLEYWAHLELHPATAGLGVRFRGRI